MVVSKASVIVAIVSAFLLFLTGYIVIGTWGNPKHSDYLKFHVVFASFGSFLFMPVSFMIFAFHTKDMRRRNIHVWLATLGMACIIASMFCAYMMKEEGQKKTIEHFKSKHAEYGISSYTMSAVVTFCGLPIMYFARICGPFWLNITTWFHRIVGVVTFLLWVITNYYSAYTGTVRRSAQFSILSPDNWAVLFVLSMIIPFIILYNPWMHPKFRVILSRTRVGRILRITAQSCPEEDKLNISDIQSSSETDLKKDIKNDHEAPLLS